MNRRRFLKTLTGLLAALPFVGVRLSRPDSAKGFTSGSVAQSVTWGAINRPPSETELIRVSAKLSNHDTLEIHAHGSNGQIFYTADDGRTWQEYSRQSNKIDI